MQQLTKQELQAAVTQLRIAILGQAATKQDISRAVSSISQQSASQIDVQLLINQQSQKILDKLDQQIKQQQQLMQQIVYKLDTNLRKQAQAEDRLFRVEASIIELLAGSEAIERVVHKDYASQSASKEAQQEARYAQRPAFGLF